ncbi:MAG: carbon-nitrogen family hydrolase [Armatimonadetes bacterium]|nr:carbon-nitrogen family hydrolase [Armatimonadota bacterium]
MRTAILQHDTAWEDRPENFRKIERLLDSVMDQKPELACMPEMFASGFSLNVAGVAEEPEGPTFHFLRELARSRGVAVQGTFPEKVPGDDKGLNTCVTFDARGRLLCRYHKIHPFSYGGEDRHYRKGSMLPVFSLGPFSAATPICYDLRFPEIFRHAMRRGANLFIVPANWPEVRQHHWRALSIARAIENLSWVVAINRTGQGGNLVYAGGSLVIAPTGEVVLEMDAGEQAAVVDVDPAAMLAARDRFRFLDDVRHDLMPDLFGVLEKTATPPI